MASDEAFITAEKRIREVLRTGATELDLSGLRIEKSLKLTELLESLGHLTQLQSLNLSYERGAVLRQLQSWLKEKDPGFGGLVRVQNKRQEFLWVHPRFESEY